ncbi:MAG TPA: LysE family translocator [Synergistales bacterium]|nr:LysE family translocator [Synergistales bacterium]
MENIELIPAMIFIFVASITPGPNNIACASMGLVFGYSRTLRFIAGILTGFFIVMFLCGSMSGVVLTMLPSLTSWVRWIGCGYILWLAYLTFKASYSFEGDGEEKQTTELGFLKGVVLQFLNPKLIFYGMTLYSAFLPQVASHHLYLLISNSLLTFASFFTLSIWALFGTGMKKYITSPRLKKYINISLSLLLVYTAISLLTMSH